MKVYFVIIGIFIILIFNSNLANANILTKCGSSEGWAYYFEGGMVPPGQGGWTKDEISGGVIEVHISSGSVDIVFKDATGGVYRHSALGGNVQIINMVRQADGGSMFIIAVENSETALLESYLFKLNSFGAGVVLWSSMRSGGIFPKASLMKAPCYPPG
ncbi:hypothetical protein [Oceanibaculum indicum]|uniref:hypothetical protein n=1 Tax=Oceanibaculum indicum TaxID=526216 RepID=UPI0011C3B7C8|nr:hypothetical protein [Oceanibaculum indicum]